MMLILLGPPGAGKGTQAAQLAKQLNIPQVATGDILRAARQAATKLGKQVEGYMLAGQLVPDGLVTDLVRERLQQEDARQGCILDGFPRTLKQAEALEGILAEKGRHLDRVLNLEVNEDELVKRLLGRGREDDKEKVIRDRLRVYQNQTEPLIGYYKKKGLLQNVNGIGTVAEIFRRLAEACQK